MRLKPKSDRGEKVELICNSEEEANWLRAVANGDRTSFRNLYERFEAILFSTIYKVLNHREDTEDVLQEVFAQIWSKAHLYDSTKGKPLTWVNTMARNRAIDRYRAKQRRSLLGERYENQTTVDFDRNDDGPEREVYQHEAETILRAAVIELTPEQRESIELVYFGGLTQREVADQIGAEIGTVKARIRRGIQRLGKKVSDEL